MCATFNIIYFEFCLLVFFYNVKKIKGRKEHKKRGKDCQALLPICHFFLSITNNILPSLSGVGSIILCLCIKFEFILIL
jgi:hypothetical protein